jgi:hypothetical protein
MRAVHNKTKLFFLIYCFTYNVIKLLSFKVLPSTLATALPTLFPVPEHVLERVLQLQEQEKVSRGQIWRGGQLGDNSRLMLRQKFMDKE